MSRPVCTEKVRGPVVDLRLGKPVVGAGHLEYRQPGLSTDGLDPRLGPNSTILHGPDTRNKGCT